MGRDKRAHDALHNDAFHWEKHRLGRAFYARPVLAVARDVVGKILVHRTRAGTCAGRIVECEAYRGPADRAAHSHGGRRTPRVEAMYGRAGHAYVFFVYGMHWQFNLVTGEVGEPHAVLIRAIEPLSGLGVMAKRRGMSPARRELTNGPGKLCVAFAIDGDAYGADLCRGSLFLAEEVDPRRPRVVRSRRIGIDYAGAWAKKPWRFSEAANPWVSRPPKGSLTPG
jgi:DNA-3-methyladenine glycosylase